MTEWRNVPGFGRYCVSEAGEVRGRFGRLMRLEQLKGYLTLKVWTDDVTDADIISHLASGAALISNDDNGWSLVTRHGEVSSVTVMRLSSQGWLDGFANGGGARLSDAGRRSYIRSMDELGDGKLIAPKDQT